MQGNEQGEAIKLMREVLGESYTHLRVHRAVIEEALEEATSVTCEVTDETTGENSIIAGKGVGVIDAFFKGFVDRFATEYPSLKTVRITSFQVNANMETKSDYAGTDSAGEVSVGIMNSAGKFFRFSHSSRSVIASSIITMLLGLEYFINSERAYITLHEAFTDAHQRGRDDLVQHYTRQMAVLVRNTSYSEVIERIRTESEK